MRVRFYISPDTDRPHVEQHGLATWECVQVLENPLQDYASHAGSRIAQGRTGAGHNVKVVYKRDEEGDRVFVITAYPLRGNELAALKRRLRRKGRQA